MVNNNNTRVSKLEGAMNFCVSDALAFEDHVRYVDQLNLKNQERLDKIEDYLATRKEEPDHYEIYGKLEGCLELYEKAKSEQKLVNNTLIESGSIASGETKTIQVPNPADATYTIKDSDNTTLYSGSIASGGDLQQTITDAVATLKNSLGTTLSTTNIKAEGSDDVIAPDAGITLNGYAFPDIPSGTTDNIEVRQSTGATLVGSKQGQFFRIADSTAILKDSAGSTISTTSIKAEGSENITAPDGTVTVNSSAFGSVLSDGTLDVPVEYEDTTNVGTISGGKVIIPNNRYNASSIGKTGQTTSYRTNDDGFLRRGNGSTFFILSQNNVFGNTTRFVDVLGDTTFANNIVLDTLHTDFVNKTIAGWYRVPLLGNTNWNTAIDNQPYAVSGYNWYLPNRKEAESICNYEVATTRLNYTPFNLTESQSGQGFWTTTTNIGDITLAFRLGLGSSLTASANAIGILNQPKSANANILLFRYFTFSELGL